MRYRRFGRRRRRATWAYADRANMTLGNGTSQVSFFWLIPPARTGFLCDTDRVSQITYMGSMLWLDFHWSNTASGVQAIPDIDFYAIVDEADTTGSPVNAASFLDPYSQPIPPGGLVSWTGNPETTGTDAYLWTHHIKGGSPPNALVGTYGVTVPAVNGVDNQAFGIIGGTVDTATNLCRKFHVAAEWQPDVHIKAKRRLRKDEGVALMMVSLGFIPPAGVRASMDVHCRTLVSRGR